MTTGNITVGASNAPYYYNRSWSGTNGKTLWNAYSTNSTKRINGSYVTVSYIYNPDYTIKEKIYTTNYVSLDPDPAYRAVITANDELAMISNLISSIKGHQLNLGVALAEGKQTISLVVSTLVKITDVARSLKKGRFDLALRHLGGSPSRHKQLYPSRKMRSNPKDLVSKDISSAWLELQYGWAPLLSDVFESAKAYESLTKKVPSYTQRVFKSRTVSRKHPNLGNGYFVGSQDSKASLLIICKYTAPPSAARSLGLTDPASIVWELVPFSFVVDWFIPIGNYLDVVHSAPQVLNATFLRSSARRDRLQFSGKALPYTGANGSSEIYTFTRSISYSYTVPKPVFKALDSALSTSHIRNAMALAHQLVF